MKTFRQKFFTSYVVLLLIFLALMFPFISNSVQQTVFRSMKDCAEEIIERIAGASDEAELVERIKAQKHLFFYRIGILDNERRLLYDSHTKRLLGPVYFPLQFVTHPEVEEALQSGIGYSEDYSHLLAQKMIYLAKRFDFHGKQYVLRLAFPFQYIQELRKDFTADFVLFSSLILLLFTAITVLILNHLSSPIRQIMAAIRDFNEGKTEELPTISLDLLPRDDFTHFANTINTLSLRLKRQINLVTKERNDRETVLNGLSDGVVAIDKNGIVLYENKNAGLLLNLQKSLTGNLFPAHLLPACADLVAACAKDCSTKSQPFEHHDGLKKQFFHLVAIPLASTEGTLLVIQDISLQHKVLEMRKAFIDNASHELKTPITVIRGFAETLQDNPDLSRETVDQILHKIVVNSEKMTNIVKNLLTLADIENLPSFRLQPTNIQELIGKLAASVKDVYADAVIEILVDGGEAESMLEADPELIETAFSNILDNSLKYSLGPAQITIVIKNSASFLSVSFKDSGPGIPQEEIKHIFKRFYRANQVGSKKIGGSGLGLSIVEMIITKHLGSVNVISELGSGSTFTIAIPQNLSAQLSCR